MTWKIINVGDPGKDNKFGGDDFDKISKYFSGVIEVDPVDINTTTSYRTTKFILRGTDLPDGDPMPVLPFFNYIFNTSTITSDINITLPIMTQDDQLTFDFFATTLQNKTMNINENTFKHGTTNVAGDLLKNNGTQYIRFASSGVTGQVLTVQSGGDLAWATPASGGWSASATETLTNKTINATNNTLTDTSTSLGDILKSNGTKFLRLGRGTANQLLITNSGATDVAWGQAVDASIAAHTSTKITITNKTQLPTSAVYNDQTNTYSIVDQIFQSARLKILNPAQTFSYNFTASAILSNITLTLPLLSSNDQITTDAGTTTLTNKTLSMQTSNFKILNPAQTFSYIFASSAITADRTVTLPLLTSNDTMATIAFAQTLTNKTIDGTTNTIQNVQDNSLSSNVLFKTSLSTPRRKYGWYNIFSGASGSGMCSGLLSNDTVGTGAATNFTYSTTAGVESARQLTTGTTSGNLSSVRFNGVFLQRRANPYFGARFKIENATGLFRVFIGFSDISNAAVTSVADPLATHFGVALWLDTSAGSGTSWQSMVNSGAGSSTKANLSTNQTVDTNIHTLSITGSETNTNWTIVYDAITTTISTSTPGSTNSLGWVIYVEARDTTSRNLDIMSADCEAL